MTARKQFTVGLTWAVVALIVGFALMGFIDQGYDAPRVTALFVTLAIFSWFLSESLETYLEHRTAKNWRQWTTATMGVVLFAVEVHLVHYGLAWLFGDVGLLPLYLASAGFSFLTVTAKANYGKTYTAEELAPVASEAPAAPSITIDMEPAWTLQPVTFDSAEIVPFRGDLSAVADRLERVTGNRSTA